MPQKRKQTSKLTLEKLPIYLGTVIIILIIAFLAYQKFNNIPVAYKGITPCADCPGIEETVTFYKDMTYTDKNIYLERNVSYTDNGKWSIINGTKSNPNATVYQLINEKDSHKSYFILEENQIRPLDPDMNEIDSPFNTVLKKQT